MKYYPRWTPGIQCPKNDAIICPDQSKCDRCGWDPKVSEKRLAKLIEQRKKKRRAAASGKHN